MPRARRAETMAMGIGYGARTIRARTGALVVAAVAAVVLLGGCMPLLGQVPVRSVPAAAHKPAAKPAPKPKPTAAPPVRVLNGANVGVSFYGSVLSWSRTDLDNDLNRLHAMGATWVRIPMNWVTLEPQHHVYNWGPADQIVADASARHIKIDAVVSYTPAWARPVGSSKGTDPPTNPGDYANFMQQLVARYAPHGVHTYEVWNEPNIISMWTPNPDASKYAALLRVAYPAIKHADRNATVLAAGLSPGWDAPDGTQIAPVTFTARLYAFGAGHSFDALALHPSTYPYPSTYQASWSAFQQAPQLASIMHAHGDASKKIWATEIGFPTGTSHVAVTEAAQATDLVNGMAAWAHYAFAGPIFVYSMRDEGPNRSNEYDNFGLVRTTGTAKPAFIGLQRAILG
jgi:hypothetical protein